MAIFRFFGKIMLVMALLLSGCLHAPALPKLITIRYVNDVGTRMSMVCVHETRADYRPESYECDTGEMRK